ncbi:hypothetical protein N0V93_002750 [Gnomoniopsis smithogilvyi]|uniref:N-acetyltransferase domain-containing protein n=1 Tax=Gnomoniopsis smithogilvyi TaxID=1191159 RepID=A0A9W9CZC6_9PEZI|nr:hypothetical protein N0V93_002750 [Gnomoniopsis smithogilvyi]
MVQITHLLTTEDIGAYLPSLCSLLQACVNPDPSSSSIGFLAPLSEEDAEEYWMTVGLKLGKAHHLFVLTDEADHEVLATVQLITVLKATHKHRGEVSKLLVRPSAQRRGLGELMIDHVETFAREEMGMQLLTLDTNTTTAARDFYKSTGWIEWGACPDYAAFADGKLGSATFFRKHLK